MCHRHHKETDDINKFTEEILYDIKRNHETQFTESGKQLSNEMIVQIPSKLKYY